MALAAGERATQVSQTSPMKWMEEFAEYDSETGQTIRFFGPFEPPDLTGAADTETIIVISEPTARLDKLADQYLGDRNLWWVLALYNDMDLPEDYLCRGLQLHIPDRQWVRDNVINLPRTQRRVM